MDIMAKTLRLIKRCFPHATAHLRLDEWKGRMRDGRNNPQVPAGTIAQAVAEMVPRRQSSMLEVDQNGRLPEVKSWFGSSRKMVVSDTTLVRSLASFALKPVRDVLWDTAARLLNRPMMRVELASGREVRIGNLDGSQWGRFPGCVLTLVGRRVDIVAGYRMSPGRGHELATARKVLREARQRLGRGFVDLLAVDALYMTEQDFKWALQQGGYPPAKYYDGQVTCWSRLAKSDSRSYKTPEVFSSAVRMDLPRVLSESKGSILSAWCKTV